MKGGANFVVNHNYLDENLHNINLQVELAMQIISNNKIVRNNTVEDLKDFNSQSLSTQAKKGEQLVSLVPAFKKAFDLMGDDIIELSTENDALKNKMALMIKNGWRNLKQKC